MADPTPDFSSSLSPAGLTLTRLVAARQSRSIAYRVAAASGAAGAGPDALPELRECADPARMTRAALLAEVLVPALGAGWLSTPTAEEFWPLADALPDAQLAEWAAAVLRRYPWPPGFHVPDLYEFITSEAYLAESHPPSERQIRTFTASLGPDAWHWFVYPRKTSLVTLVWGKGSGKDWLSACILAYASYAITSMRNPWFHFRTLSGEPMDCINVAETQDLAREVFFVKLERMLKRPCFAPLLDQRPGRHIQADKVTFWKQAEGRTMKVRALRLLSLNSKAESVEGKNTLFWVMDEADAFRTKENHANAWEMFTKLSTSNRFADRQIGIIISYPRSRNGFVLQMLAECGNRGGPRTNAWGDLAPTWEVLPFKVFIPAGVGRWTNPAGGVGEVPDTIIQSFYENDPVEYRAVYACEPPAAIDAFIENEAKIDEAVAAAEAAGLEPVARVETYYRTDKTPSGKEYRYVCKRLAGLDLRPGVLYYAGGDAGVRQDSFALALFHIVPPGEAGYICPICWEDRTLRRSKHYVAAPLPKAPNGTLRLPFTEVPRDWACDHCHQPPSAHHDFWGSARATGRRVLRPVVERIAPSGQITWKSEEWLNPATGATETRPVMEAVQLPLVVQDLLIEWTPDRREGIEVDFESVNAVLLDLAATKQLDYVKIDQWQAEEKLQKLRAAGINADVKQMSNPEQLRMYRNYKDLLYSNLLWLLPGHPKARQQLRELQLLNGIKIDHPDTSSDGTGRGGKDLCDAEAIAIQLACELLGRRARIVTSRARANVPAEQGIEKEGRHQKQAREARGGIVAGQLRDLGLGSLTGSARPRR